MVLLTLTLASDANAQAKDKVVWGGGYYSKPASILDGPDKREQILTLFKERLTAHEHEEVQASIPRILSEIKNGSPWCFIGATKTPERDSFGYFSFPSALVLPVKIVIRSDQRARFESMGELSLEALLANRTLRTSTFLGRAYTPEIDALLKRFPPSQVHSDAAEAVQMLLAGRLDYIVDDAKNFAKRHVREGKLVALPFKEMGGADVTRVMCSKNEWGKQVINEINTILHIERPTARYRRILETGENEGDVREIRKFYDSVLLKAE